MENEEQTKNIKGKEKEIFSDVIYKRWRKNECDYWMHFTHKIKSYTVDALIDTSDEQIEEFSKSVKESAEAIFKGWNSYVSEQQLNFYYDCTRLIFSKLKVNNPVLIPVRCGFGKSTYMRALIGTLISRTKFGFNSRSNANKRLPMIITTERIDDLKKIQKYITKRYGEYNTYTFWDDKKSIIRKVIIPYVYVLEGWNKKIECKNFKKVKSYKESLERCNGQRCEFYDECELSHQRQEQVYSPIVAMTNQRLQFLTNAADAEKGILKYTKFIDKDENEMYRKTLLIDEKPNLLNVSSVSVDLVGNMINLINKYDTQNEQEKDDKKLQMIKELNKINSRIIEIQEEFKDYRNAFVLLDEEIFSETFKENWFGFFYNKYSKDINALEDMFKNGALWCKSGKNMFFYNTSRNRFNIGGLKTFIFDGTAELSLEYETEDDGFIFLGIDDYKKYDYLTFHIIHENFSRDAINRHPKKLDAVCKWINKNITEKAYVISYRECMDIAVNEYLSEKLKDNPNVVMCKDTNKLPYFGNTKGKNLWNQCGNMVQIGWNRYDSDTYIANYLASSEIIRTQIKERYEEYKYKLPEILFSIENGKFTFHELEQFRLMSMIVDFEQEAFRTRIREFSSNSEVHIYIFSAGEAMREMIFQRFKGCKFIIHEDVPEFDEFRKLEREGNDHVNRLIKWIDEDWDRKKVPSKKVKEELDIKNDSWTYLFNKDKKFKKMLNERNVTQRKIGNGYYLVSTEKKKA